MSSPRQWHAIGQDGDHGQLDVGEPLTPLHRMGVHPVRRAQPQMLQLFIQSFVLRRKRLTVARSGTPRG